MMTHPVVFAVVLVTATALTVVGVMMIMAALERREDARAMAERLGSNRLDAVFLFEDGALIDANERGETLLRTLRAAGPEKTPWLAVRHYLTPGFPDLDQQLGRLAQQGALALRAHDSSGLELQAEWLSGTIRMTLTDTEAEEGGVLIDRLSLRAMEEETGILRRVCEHAPVLTWREDAAGRVTWANHAYLHLCARQSMAEGACQTFAWPLPALFPAGPAGTTLRLALAGTGRGWPEHWFDVIRHADGDHQLAFALSADSAHRAEQTRLEFVQTLSKTFANLPIGLAVFDRARRLQLFNPALADLTRLEPEFLTSRPSLAGFLNRLREKRVLPEPRNYENWSRRLLDIEKGVETSEFEETWLLASGQTYRVSVSPHLDGAMAFLVEDITTEIHMSRNIRAELETCQNALDGLPTAIAVFSADGQLVQTNAAFSRLWSFEGETAIAGVTLAEALANWREASADKVLWDDIAALGTRGRPQARVTGTMALTDGEVLSVSACGTGSAMLMITFDLAAPTAMHGVAVPNADAVSDATHSHTTPPVAAGTWDPPQPTFAPDMAMQAAFSQVAPAAAPASATTQLPDDDATVGGGRPMRSGKPMRSGRIVRASA